MNTSFRPTLRRLGRLPVCLAAATLPLCAATVRNARLELQAELHDDAVHLRLTDHVARRTWVDGPGAYTLQLTNGNRFTGLQHARIRTHESGLEISGDLGGSAVRVTQDLALARSAMFLEERITLENRGARPLDLADLAFGFRRQLGEEAKALRWVAVPYRRQVDGKLHDYAPPLNWNELFDVGWYHSNREELAKHYTREALFNEAAKARDLGCDLLYLDPGWEICEGTTLWDAERLGRVTDFARERPDRRGLRLAARRRPARAGLRPAVTQPGSRTPPEAMTQHVTSVPERDKMP